MIFIDTSIFIALFSSTDKHHKQIDQLFERIVDETLVTSFDVVVETINWFTRKTGPHLAAKAAEKILSEEAIRIMYASNEDQFNALEYIRKYSDQCISYTDALSFSLINRLKINRVFTLGKDFNLLKGVENIFMGGITSV